MSSDEGIAADILPSAPGAPNSPSDGGDSLHPVHSEGSSRPTSSILSAENEWKAVIGVDLGCYTTYVAGIKDGGVEVLADEYSHLFTPTAVSFNAAPRPMGYTSKQQLVPKFKSTCAHFKPLLCRTVEDHGPIIDAIPCETHPVNLNSKDLYATVSVLNSKNEQMTLTIQQVLAAFLTKLFSIAKAAIGVNVEQCLLTVPYYLTVADRYVIMEAAQIAEFPFIELINETAALTASYAFLKKTFLPDSPEQSKKVVFVDVGYSQAQLVLAEVHQHGAKVLLAHHSREVGGFFFDNVIRNYFADEFQRTQKMDARSNRRAWLRLAEEAERAKKSVCAAATKTIAQIECLMEERDFKAEIDRAMFEELAADIFRAFEKLVRDFLAETKINPADVEVELVGGSSRVPLIRGIVERLFGHEAKTTMNQDEAIARGTALMCGILSRRVPEFRLEDFAPATVLAYYRTDQNVQRQITLVSRGDTIPVTKNVTLFIPSVDIVYEEERNSKRPDLYHISHIGLPSNPEANPNAIEPTEYCFPFCYKLSHFVVNTGCIRIDEGLQSVINHVLTISKGVNSSVDPSFVQKEKDMREVDEDACKKADAKNSLEGQFFAFQNSLENQSELFDSAKTENLRSFMLQIEDFLYEDDADFKIEDYTNKLNELKKHYEEAKLPGLKIEEAPANEAMEVDPKEEEPTQ